MDCPRCGQPAGRRDRFCEECGYSLLVDRTPVGGPGDVAGRDRMEYDLEPVAGISDRGRRRSRNEDSMAFGLVRGEEGRRGVAAVVCDGVATTERSEAASQLAADAAVELLLNAVADGADPEEATRTAVAAAVAAVGPLARPDGSGGAPSCTFVSAVVTKNTVTVGSVGDSRVYWLDDADATSSRVLTTDDTVAAELVAEGMTEEAARAVPQASALSRWIGADAPGVGPRVLTVEPTGTGLVLLCSDGLWNYLPEPDALRGAVPGPPGAVTPMAVAAALTKTALDCGGGDNVTVVAIPFPPAGDTRLELR